jgi:neutral ceramidase
MGVVMKIGLLRLLLFALLSVPIFTACSGGSSDDSLSIVNTAPPAPENEETPYWKACADNSEYLVGAGISDITGPFTDISCGYNEPGVKMQGLAMRLYSRAFIIKDPCTGSSVVLVTAEMLHMYQGIKLEVVKRLDSAGLGKIYGSDNIMIGPSHTHSAPSNISWYTMYNAYNGVIGFDPLHFEAVVAGITDSIIKAHGSLKPGRVMISSKTVDEEETLDGGRIITIPNNRSLNAYEQNADKNLYSDNVDRTMTLLRFEDAGGNPIGLLNWFAVHGTSISMNNRLMHSDAKGFAAYKLEKEMPSGFVAAFAQGAMGDASPNQPQSDITKAFLRPYDFDSVLTDLDNAGVYGNIQYKAARALLESTGSALHGGVWYRQVHADFNDLKTEADYIMPYARPWDDTSKASTCTSCLGLAVLAGDEEGAPVDFAKEGDVRHTYSQDASGSWQRDPFDFSYFLEGEGLSKLIAFGVPVLDLIISGERLYGSCQKEKVVLLPLGKTPIGIWPNRDIPWMPTILPVQVFVVGDLAIVASPFEVTTMAGRRTKADVLGRLKAMGINTVIVQSMTNAYASYLTTREEYAAQNFEGSFTMFGPYQEAAFRQEADMLAVSILNNTKINAGPAPLDIGGKQLLLTPVARNGTDTDKGECGLVITQPDAAYSLSTDNAVSAVFIGADPRTVLELSVAGELQSYFGPDAFSFIKVERKAETGWATFATDKDPYTTLSLVDNSDGGINATVTFRLKPYGLTPPEPGTYRITCQGIAKKLKGLKTTYEKFQGVTGEFVIK